MTISSNIAEALTRGSWIRKMFEEGRRLKEQFGDDNVFDFSLGNPDLPPPAEFQRILEEEAARQASMIHCYMPNGGYGETRNAVAGAYAESTGLPFEMNDIIMSSGAGGGLNILLKAIMNPGDEVIVLAPYFVEYGFYVANHQGRLKVSETDQQFQPCLDDIDRLISSRTAALIVNSPNNPTGAVYSPETMRGIGELLRVAAQRVGRTIYLVSDEPYREIMFDGKKYFSPFNCYDDTVVITSHSKDLSLAGERIGHVAISPHCGSRNELSAAVTFCNRILGFVNANALMQRVVARLQGTTVDVSLYERRRDLLCESLADAGYEFVRPEGAFYLFPKSPLPRESDFCALLAESRVIVVPGSGFYRPGYFRISYAVDDQIIERSLELFRQAAKTVGLA
jgi:aspartate aminotransferase